MIITILAEPKSGSTLDRIVMAGNVGFDFIKNQKSII
jgi:hypothetical protein